MRSRLPGLLVVCTAGYLKPPGGQRVAGNHDGQVRLGEGSGGRNPFLRREALIAACDKYRGNSGRSAPTSWADWLVGIKFYMLLDYQFLRCTEQMESSDIFWYGVVLQVGPPYSE